MVVADGGADDGLVGASEIMLVIGCVAVGMNGVLPDIFDGGQLDLQLFVAQGDICSYE